MSAREDLIREAAHQGYGAYRLALKEARKKKPREYKESSIWTFRAAAVQWLRYTRGCPLVAIERGLGPCNPDVIGVEKSRFLTEVEIKRTMADFRANAQKQSLKIRELCGKIYPIPKHFYFLVPVGMVDAVKAELPPGAGLLSFGKPSPYGGVPEIMVLVSPKAAPLARRLNARECVEMARAQSGSLFSVMKHLHKHPELCPEEAL